MKCPSSFESCLLKHHSITASRGIIIDAFCIIIIASRGIIIDVLYYVSSSQPSLLVEASSLMDYVSSSVHHNQSTITARIGIIIAVLCIIITCIAASSQASSLIYVVSSSQPSRLVDSVVIIDIKKIRLAIFHNLWLLLQ